MAALQNILAIIEAKFGVYNPKRYGARFDGTTDDTTAILATIAAAPAGSTIVLPAGTAIVTQMTITKDVSIRGQGRGRTVLKAAVGATGPLLNFNYGAAISKSQVSGFWLDLTNAPTIDGIFANNFQQSVFEDIYVKYGATGISLANCGSTHLRRIRTESQTANAILVDGDTCAEMYYRDIEMSVNDAAVTLAAGLHITRTTATDIGGHYLKGIRQTRLQGSITTGILIESTAADTYFVLFMDEIICDNVDGSYPIILRKVNNCRINNAWFTCSSGSTVQAMLIDAGRDINVSNAWFDGHANGSVTFANSAQFLTFTNCRATNGPFFTLPGSNKPTSLAWSNIRLGSSSTLCADLPSLAAAAAAATIPSGPLEVLTHPSSVSGSTFALRDATANTAKFFRVASSALEMLDNGFANILFKITDIGQMTARLVSTHTNSIVSTLILKSTSSNTPLAGFGTALLIQGKTSTTTDRDMVQIAGVWTTPTEASQSAAIDFYNVSAGAALAQRARLTDSGSFVSVGGHATKVRSVSGNATIDATDHTVLVDTTGGVVTLTLPAATALNLGLATKQGQRLEIKRTAGTNVLTVSRAGSDTVEGATSITVPTTANSARVIQSDGISAWWITGNLN